MNNAKPKPSPPVREKPSPLSRLYGTTLYDADPKCRHVIVNLSSGVKCAKCRGWFCF